MRANVDESCYSDPRFRRLARLMGWHIDWAVGAVTRLWLVAQHRVKADPKSNPRGLMPAEDLEDSTDHRGLIEAMLESGLAERADDGRLYLAGMEKAASWLGGKLDTASAGGSARAATAARGPDGRMLPKSSDQPSAGPEVQPAGPATPAAAGPAGPVIQRSGSGSGSGSGSCSKRLTASPPAQPALVLEPTEHREPKPPAPATLLKALWLPWFRTRYGDEFKWFGKEGVQAARLMTLAGDRGAGEVIRRADIAAAQSWRTTPVTLGTLVECWNGLSVEVVPMKLSREEQAELERARRVTGGPK
jgi:hypothetical protein